jgi:hypothetical protein
MWYTFKNKRAKEHYDDGSAHLYTLMHKDIPVADVLLESVGIFVESGKIFDERRLPVGVGLSKDGIDLKALNDWWRYRSIPKTRPGLDFIWLKTGELSPIYFLEKCYGLSLSDQYWIRPESSGLEWKDINFFENDFSKDMGELLFGNEPVDCSQLDLNSPDNTTDGWLRKKWIIKGSKRYLMKGNRGFFQQEPFNEAIASAIMARLGVNHINYTLTFDRDDPYSLCENFITPETDLIPAWRIYNAMKKPNDRSDRNHFLACCDTLGVPGVKDALDKMLTVDYIIANEDRHYNNFGCVRNADTLEWLGLAPVFDSGTSLWYNKPNVGSRVDCKPFRKTHEEQIKLVSDLSWFNINALDDLTEQIAGIYSASPEIDEARRTAIANNAAARAMQIERMQ